VTTLHIDINIINRLRQIVASGTEMSTIQDGFLLLEGLVIPHEDIDAVIPSEKGMALIWELDKTVS